MERLDSARMQPQWPRQPQSDRNRERDYEHKRVQDG